MTDTTTTSLDALGIKPVAWIYEHDGMIHDESNPALVSAFRREHLSREPWTETPLYSKTNLATLLAKARRVEVLEVALRDLIEHCWETEKALTEKGYRMDYCGESWPLTKARAALKENTDATSD